MKYNKHLFTYIFFFSCKKDSIEDNSLKTDLNYTESVIDSVYMLASSLYLWNGQLPAYSVFNPKKYVGLDVSLVGQKTYGKPVVFFAVPIGKYNIFLSSFLTTNAEGNAKYFQGMPVDVEALDDFNYDFMDFKEDCFYSALSEFNLKLTKARSLLLKKKKTIKMLNVEPINNLLNDDITSVPYSK